MFNVWTMLVALPIWAAALYGTLNIHTLPASWAHSICGPWGCGPPTEALVACHGFWCVLGLPIAAIAAARLPVRQLPRLAGLLLGLGALGIVALGAWEAVNWLPHVAEHQRGYFPQRWMFSIATRVDFPIAQMLLAGALVLAWCRFLRPEATPEQAQPEQSETSSE